MRVVIEFYRTRDADDAHALVGRENAEALDAQDAIAIARRLALTLDMPQRPDAMSVTSAWGKVLYSGDLGIQPDNEGGPSP
jgi:hypothetical protein